MNEYKNRQDAGRKLADELAASHELEDPLVLGLPRGGVPVAFEVAAKLGAELDLIMVRKLGVPGHKELAFGAIASGGGKFIDEQIVQRAEISQPQIEEIHQHERAELQRREQTYRGDQPHPEIQGRSVILVDDGVATGSTMIAAARAIRHRHPEHVIIAVPVGPPETFSRLESVCNDVVCPLTPQHFRAVGQWYSDFEQTSDDEVRDLLDRARRGDLQESTQ